jgi:hypothetical protein
MDHHERARTLFADVGDRGGEGRALNHVGMIHCWLGRSDQALDQHERALAIFTRLDVPEAAELRTELGHLTGH